MGKLKKTNIESYFGILKDVEINNLNENVVEILVNKNIFDFFILADNHRNDSLFGGKFVFNNKFYSLSKDFCDEIYGLFELLIDESKFLYVESDKNKTILELEGLIEKNEKIEYLKKKHFDLFKNIENESLLRFLEIDHINEKSFKTWKEEFKELISESDDFIQSYLKGEYHHPHNTDVYPMWIEFYKTTELSSFYKELILKLKSNNEKSGIAIDTSKQVLLFEKLMLIKDWDSLSANKKGKILSFLFLKNSDNIKSIYLQLEKSTDKNSKLFEDDVWADELINNLG